jgi:hypothetical protein
MASGECPLRLTCENAGDCGRTGIAFDTLDGYPPVKRDGKPISLVDVRFVCEGVFPEPQINGVSVFDASQSVANSTNVWGLALCDGAGAINENGELRNPDDVSQIDVLEQATRGNTWPGELERALEVAPTAPWATVFRAEIERRERHKPYSPVQPCADCEFAGSVTEVSPANMETSDRSTQDVACFRYVQENHKTGEVAVVMTGSSSPEVAASRIMDNISQCVSQQHGPVEGRRFHVAGIGFGTLRACGALYDVDKKGVVRAKPGVIVIDGPQEVVELPRTE